MNEGGLIRISESEKKVEPDFQYAWLCTNSVCIWLFLRRIDSSWCYWQRNFCYIRSNVKWQWHLCWRRPLSFSLSCRLSHFAKVCCDTTATANLPTQQTNNLMTNLSKFHRNPWLTLKEWQDDMWYGYCSAIVTNTNSLMCNAKFKSRW